MCQVTSRYVCTLLIQIPYKKASILTPPQLFLSIEKVAVKIIDKTKIDSASRRLIFREMTILDKLHHPNIIRLYEVIESLTRLSIVMEYAAGGDMETRIQKKGPFTDPEGKIIFAQLVAAISHLHDHNIVHRDIKAENIFFALRSPAPDDRSGSDVSSSVGVVGPGLVNSASSSTNPNSRNYLRTSGTVNVRNRRNRSRNPFSDCECDSKQALEYSPDFYRVKIGDFGFSKSIDSPDQQLTTFCGSPPYAAPELFSSSSYLGPPVDMWAMGVLLYYMLVGFLPFRGRTVGQLRKIILEATSTNSEFRVPPRVSEGATILIQRLLTKNPLSRPKASKLIEEATRTSHSSLSISMDRLVGVTMNASPWHRNEPWMAHQVFPKPYPQINPGPPGGALGARLMLAEAKKKAKLKAPSPDSSPTSSFNNSKSSNILKITVTPPDSNGGASNACSAVRLPKKISPSEEAIVQSEIEAARILLQLGISTDRLAAPCNGDARNSITGAYRIMLHQLQRYRRLSNFPPSQDKSTSSDYEGYEDEESYSKEEGGIPRTSEGKYRMKKSASDIPPPLKNYRLSEKSCSIL
nr:serine:threonine protein kinase NIM1 [Hymenolepis microstoma]